MVDSSLGTEVIAPLNLCLVVNGVIGKVYVGGRMTSLLVHESEQYSGRVSSLVRNRFLVQQVVYRSVL